MRLPPRRRRLYNARRPWPSLVLLGSSSLVFPAPRLRPSIFLATVQRYSFAGTKEHRQAYSPSFPEERHDFYKLVRLRVIIYPNCDLEISWAGGEGLLFSTSESVSKGNTYPRMLPVLSEDLTHRQPAGDQ